MKARELKSALRDGWVVARSSGSVAHARTSSALQLRAAAGHSVPARVAVKIDLAGIVGAGVMGRGIAQLFATAGIHVRLHDTAPGAARAAIASIGDVMDRSVSKGRMTRADADAVLQRLTAADALEDLANCGIVVESIVEDLEAKRALLSRLEGVVSGTCVLVTNTSSFSVAAIAAACRVPHRVAGLHFFNPAPLMKVVEVIPGARTDPAVADALVDLVTRLGHRRRSRAGYARVPREPCGSRVWDGSTARACGGCRRAC